ncbi:unnamed protein product [Phytophthora fragariaefolia]|uniref:Unnamed protein product n=1 Tax=Phytophthora fragariaefolia TaxID=1490495 RepID=A0A9W6WZA3_9STRA|nr:unnamed protein product [Phytophthora fragariaefolia]
MQSLSKRKIREEADTEEDRKRKAGSMTTEEKNPKETETVGAGPLSIPRLRFATESWSGMKTSNEDRHLTSTDQFPGPVFGIFDGHGGTFTADFLARQLVKTAVSVMRQNLGGKALSDLQECHSLSTREKNRRDAIAKQRKLLRQQLTEVEAMRSVTIARASANCDDTTDDLDMLSDQLRAAVSQMDSEVEQIDAEEAARNEERQLWCQEQHEHFVRSFKDTFERVDAQILQKNPTNDGSTALLVWFLADSVRSSDSEGDAVPENVRPTGGLTFYTVNLGDCRAVVCRGGEALPLTSDHKPDRLDEKKRIEKAGGFVSTIAGIARVYSSSGAGLAMQQETSVYLAVSRAFGDRSLKTPTALVSCKPEVMRFQVQEDDLFLVMACDGVWDVLSNQDVVDIALLHFHDAKAAADAIVKASYRKGSVDNLTATVVQFGWKADAQVQQVIESRRVKADESNTSKGRNEETQHDDSAEEDIDMFNL